MSKIGANWIGDAYDVAFLLPDLMFQLLLGGALASALIPVLSQYIAIEDEDNGWKAVSTFVNVVLIGVVIFCAIGTIFAPQVVSITATGLLHKSKNVQLLAIDLTRIFLPSTAFLVMAGLCNGVLNSYRKFAAASLGPIIYNIGGIISLFIFGSSSYEGAKRVAYGIMASSLLYFIYNICVAYKMISRYRLKLYVKHEGFLKLIKLAIPTIFSSSIVQINFIISNKYATYAVSGDVKLFNTANRTWQLPLVIAQSLGMVILPAMSAFIATKEISKYKQMVLKGIKYMLMFSIPSAIGIIVLNQQIIRTLFKFSSKFSEADVALMGYLLVFFSLALIAQSVQQVLGRSFYAINNTKIPLYIGAVTCLLNLILSKVFFECSGIIGLAIATSISTLVNSILLSIMLKRKVKDLEFSTLRIFIMKVLLCSCAMGILLYVVSNYIPQSINSKVSQIAWISLIIGFGMAIFGAFAKLVKIDVFVDILSLLKRKLRVVLHKG